MEKLGSLPASRCPANTTTPRLVQMLHSDPGAEEVLKELMGQRRSEEESGLWRNLRLDWVRNWNQSSRTAILLSRRHHSGRLRIAKHPYFSMWY
ncbi:hypothetical protein LDENG_00294360 [Lucifuga dentata]|nr:hypothetical protein LDENG_00294360 [Lucifuga dentata]